MTDHRVPTAQFPTVELLRFDGPKLTRRIARHLVGLALGLPLFAGPPIAYLLLAPGPQWALPAAATPLLVTPPFLVTITIWSNHR